MNPQRIDRIEGELDPAERSGEAAWICPHRRDHDALRCDVPEWTEAVRDAYHVPEGASLHFVGMEDGEPSTDAVEVLPPYFRGPSYRDSGSGEVVPVEEAPVIEHSPEDEVVEGSGTTWADLDDGQLRRIVEGEPPEAVVGRTR